jgi:hypothetical protein
MSPRQIRVREDTNAVRAKIQFPPGAVAPVNKTELTLQRCIVDRNWDAIDNNLEKFLSQKGQLDAILYFYGLKIDGKMVRLISQQRRGKYFLQHISSGRFQLVIEYMAEHGLETELYLVQQYASLYMEKENKT